MYTLRTKLARVLYPTAFYVLGPRTSGYLRSYIGKTILVLALHTDPDHITKS
jgi:hypothetical protein